MQKEPCDVPARVRPALRESHVHRVDAACDRYDRYGPRNFGYCLNDCRSTAYHDDVHRQTGELSGEPRDSGVVAGEGSVFDNQVATLFVAAIAQDLEKCIQRWPL